VTEPTVPQPAPRPTPPDQTRDDLDVGWGERVVDAPDDDERFLRERPPHWE
jgi:hypothetical protein